MTVNVDTIRRQDGWARTFGGLVLVVWSTFTGFGVVIPVLPRLVTQELNGSAGLVGAAFATAAVVALLLRPFGGQLAQRFGTRWAMTLGGVIAIAAGAASNPGAAEALLMTAGSVWAVALAPEQRRAQVVGWYGLAMWGGLATGPLLGEVAFRTGSYPLVWVLAAALPALALLVLRGMPRGEGGDEQVSSRLLPRAAVLPGLALAGGGFGYASVTSFGALAMTDRGIAGGALLLSLFGAAYVVVRLLAGRLPDRLGPKPVILASAVLEASGLLLITLADRWWLAALGALVAGGGFTLLYPALALIAIRTAPPAERGATLGAVSSFLDLSIGVSGVIGGILADVSYAAVFGLSAALAMIGAAGGFAAIRRP